MSEINMYQNFFNTLWEFIGGKEDKDNFIQKTLKVSTLSMVCLIMYIEDRIQSVLQRHTKDKKRAAGCSCL